MERCPIFYGSQVPPGDYECLDCGHVLTLTERGALPPCNKASGELRHTKMAWCLAEGETAPEDSSPYPYPRPTSSHPNG
ncbi:MAG TPA: hypothetical protein VKZ49_17060 [Polyangiaceae bacterium]|nr:hypothetical protein [Polyangiaceae bacterium]